MSEPRWTFDRRIPVILILTLAVQTGVALVWAGEAHERFLHLERQVERNAELSDRTVRVEERLRAAVESLARIEAKLEGGRNCSAAEK
jgi:hypothetical protein